MRDLLTYELGPIPWANGKACGSLNQTTKAVLPTNLENEDAVMESKPNVTACIIDIMGVIQVLQHILETFGRMADKLLSNILEYAGTAVRVDVLGDRYPDVVTQLGQTVPPTEDLVGEVEKCVCRIYTDKRDAVMRSVTI